MLLANRSGLPDYYDSGEHPTADGAPGLAELGLLFEGALERPSHEVVRELVLDPLAMTSTWYHAFEEQPGSVDDIADVFIGGANLARSPSLTLDQAGGGLATTAEDLGRLIRGLEGGRPVGLGRLATDWTRDAMSRGLDYGYGTWRWRPGRFFPLAWQLPEMVGVSGSTNSFAYVTAKGDVITGTLDQGEDPSRHVRFILSKVLPVLQHAKS
jgi:CubicO group peptidase (beta-lactamase class C family)